MNYIIPLLIGPRSNSATGGWGAYRFRPIYRPKADLIERLMQPAPDVAPAPEVEPAEGLTPA